jgi:hypothetical protein
MTYWLSLDSSRTTPSKKSWLKATSSSASRLYSAPETCSNPDQPGHLPTEDVSQMGIRPQQQPAESSPGPAR